MQQQTSAAATTRSTDVRSTPARKAAKRTPEVVRLKRVNLKSVLRSQLDRFVSIDFVKLNGEARTLIGRLGVKSAKGGVNRADRDDLPYITLFDAQAKNYRNVNLETVSQVRASGKVYVVID